MKVSAKHIAITLLLSAVLFGLGLWGYGQFLHLVLVRREDVIYTTNYIGAQGTQAMLFGLAFALLPLFTYLGWLIVKLTDKKQKQTFVGIQWIVFVIAGAYWYLNYKSQMDALPVVSATEGSKVQVSISLDRLMISEYLIGGAIAGFVIALILSPIMKKFK